MSNRLISVLGVTFIIAWIVTIGFYIHHSLFRPALVSGIGVIASIVFAHDAWRTRSASRAFRLFMVGMILSMGTGACWALGIHKLWSTVVGCAMVVLLWVALFIWPTPEIKLLYSTLDFRYGSRL